MKALSGIKMSYRLQTVLQEASIHDNSQASDSSNHRDGGVVRGLRQEDQNVSSLNAFLYSLVRNSRQHRRALVSSLLKMFDEDAVSLNSKLLNNSQVLKIRS